MTTRFDHNTTAFSKENMWYLACCSNIAYDRSNEEVRLHLESTTGFTGNNFDYFVYKSGPLDGDDDNQLLDVQGFVIGDTDKVIVSFCGSERELADWWQDSRVNQVSWPAGQAALGAVHEGFRDSLSKVLNDIITKIKKFQTNGQGVWLTGHSMGGSLAILTAATISLQYNDIIVKGVYTFGQPRVGDEEFSSFYDSKLKQKTYRIVNYNDPVAEIPLEKQPLLTCLFGTRQYKSYRHVGHYIWYNPSTDEFDCDCTPNLWDRISKYFKYLMGADPVGGFDDFSLIKDHSMNQYESLAERVANGQLNVTVIS